jgi:hypothetical protein
VATTMMVAIAVLGFVVFVLSGVVLEMFRDIRQLREAAGILDRPLDVDIGDVAGRRPGSYGLPVALDSARSALVLFLSDRCGTCRSIAADLPRQFPLALWVVLEARSEHSAAKFVNAFELSSMVESGKLIVDVAGVIAFQIGLDVTPVGFRVENGRLVHATTVPSKRYLLSIVPNPIRLRKEARLSEREILEVP